MRRPRRPADAASCCGARWSIACSAELRRARSPAGEIELLFAGGIHDAVSSAMVQVLVAPLVARGVKVGILMGSAYLFTAGDRRQRRDRAAVPAGGDRLRAHRQARVGAGPRQPLRLHAVRAGLLPRRASSIASNGVPADESRRVLDDLILGRLRIASKGRTRRGLNGRARGARRGAPARRGHVHARPGRDPALAGDATSTRCTAR